MKVKYFAWVRERIGMAEEDIVLPVGVTSVRELLAWLQGRGEGYANALRYPDSIRVAINQEHVDHRLRGKDPEFARVELLRLAHDLAQDLVHAGAVDGLPQLVHAGRFADQRAG